MSREKGQHRLTSLCRARPDPDQVPTILDRVQFHLGHGACDEFGVRERYVAVGPTVQHQRRALDLL
jgi:hypothetical protein